MTDAIYTANTCAAIIATAQELAGSFAQGFVHDIQRGRELENYCVSLQSCLGYPRKPEGITLESIQLALL